jgi:two-component system phosphate regulon response regulator PhoB
VATANDWQVFVVEDEQDIARLIAHHLRTAEYAVRVFAAADEALDAARQQAPALFLLDIMLPGGDGVELCRRIRRDPHLARVPVIFLTAKTTERDRLQGFEVGADDYITKPFSPRELVARVRAVLRRFEVALPVETRRIRDLEIDTGAMTLRVRGALVQTTATEFRLLDYLASRPGRVFSRDQLLSGVWRDTAFVTPRSVDVYVRRLREKIERDPEQPQYIVTVRGAGYRFEVPQ